jgi:hypothetical protein
MPKSAQQISVLAGKMHTGIVEVGTSVGITVVTAPQMLADCTAFTDAEGAFNASRQALQGAYDLFHPAESALSDWLGVVRTVLAGRFGQRWSADWAAAGFVNASTSIPAQITDRLGLAQALIVFFTENPSYEVASMNVTAAYGLTLLTAATTTQAGVATADQNLRDADRARTLARNTLLGDMRGLVKNLQAKLGPDDPRWLAFGLQMPATRVTPAQPTGLVVTLDGSSALLVSCDPTALASRYRFRMRQVGPGFTYELVASTVEPMARIRPVAPGITVEIIVQAVNDDLQSVPSDSVLITMPPVAAQPVEAQATEATPLAATVPNGNGNGSAKGNGSRSLTRVS